MKTLPDATELRPDVYQSNPLIQARKEMGTIELRLFMLGLRGINPRLSPKDRLYDTEFREVFVPTAKLVEALGGNTWYLHNLEQTCDRMIRTIIKLRRADGGWKLFGIFKRIEYVPREGLYLEFNDLMRPYLLDLFASRGYTQIDVELISRLTSPYAVRLVELLLQYQNMPEMKARRLIERTLLIDDIRFSLNVPDGAYTGRMDNFRQNVLDDPIREINEKTAYKMRYEVLKRGVRVYGFKFFLDTSGLPREEAQATTEAIAGNATTRLLELGFSENAARAILAKCGSEAACHERLDEAERSLAAKKLRGGVENELGYLRAYVEAGWSAPKPKPKPKKPVPPRTGEPTSLKEIFQSLGAIAPQTPPAPRRAAFEPERVPTPQPAPETLHEPSAGEFRQGEKPVSAGIARLVAESLASGESLESVTLILALSGLTIERFKVLYT